MDVRLDDFILCFEIEIEILLVVIKVKQPWLKLIIVFILRDNRGELVDALHVVAKVLPRRVMYDLADRDILFEL